MYKELYNTREEAQRAELGVSEGVAGRKSATRLKPSWALQHHSSQGRSKLRKKECSNLVKKRLLINLVIFCTLKDYYFKQF
jgi:hypothetical protein